MRFAYSTNAYTEHDLAYALRDIAAAGFAGVEILCDVPHAAPGSVDADEIARILSGEGLAVSNLNVNTSGNEFLCLEDPPKRDAVLEALELAHRWGAANISISPVRSSDAAIRAILERSGRVRVGIEYEPGLDFGDAASVRAAIDRIGHPNLGANFDIGHAAVAEGSIRVAATILKDRIWNVHVEDIKGRIHEHLIPGLGEIDFAGAVESLRAVGYDGFLTLELYPYKKNPGEAGRRGLAHLRGVLSL